MEEEEKEEEKVEEERGERGGERGGEEGGGERGGEEEVKEEEEEEGGRGASAPWSASPAETLCGFYTFSGPYISTGRAGGARATSLVKYQILVKV